MFAGVAEMFARAMVGFAMVPVFGYWAGCIASPVAWLFACAFLLPAYHFVMARLEHPAAAGTVCGCAKLDPVIQTAPFRPAAPCRLPGRGLFCAGTGHLQNQSERVYLEYICKTSPAPAQAPFSACGRGGRRGVSGVARILREGRARLWSSRSWSSWKAP